MSKKKYSSNDIAVIGISLRFPKANSHEEFWEILNKKESAIDKLSDEKLSDLGVKKETLNSETFVKYGSILENVEDWDNDYFGYSPKAASIIDPQQRLLIECSHEVVANSGYQIDKINKDLGVFVTVANNNYAQAFSESGNQTDNYVAFTSNDSDFAASRIAHSLNAQGPTMTINTACSSSLVCIHQAINSINHEECEVAIAGGASILFPQAGYNYDPNLIFSPDGKCRPFDSKSQGTVFGNGVAVVLLKKLKKAITDQDYIYSIIKGSASVNDGNSKVSYYAPSVSGQSKTIEKALKKAQINPESIGYIEAHGTATKLGDPIEIAALEEAFSKWTNKKNFAYIGSVKSNIGHLNTAAGIAGFIKATLCLHHGVIPGLLNYESPNPEIDFENSQFKINSETINWKSDGDNVKRAGVSSFGIGGVNVHLILEESPKYYANNFNDNTDLYFPFSANSEEALDMMHVNLITFLNNKESNFDIRDLAFTLQESRVNNKYRVIYSAKIKKDLLANLHEKKQPKQLPSNLKKWLKGDVVDWAIYKPEGIVRRVQLPMYPMSKKRLSIKDFVKNTEVKFNNYKINKDLSIESTFKDESKEIYKLTLNEEYEILREHNRILPGTTYLQIIWLVLSKRNINKFNSSINNFTWEKTLKVKENENLDLFIEYNVKTQNIRFHRNDVIYASADIGEQIPTKNFKISSFVPDLGVNDIYNVFVKKGFPYGNSFKKLDSIQIKNKESIGYIENGDKKGTVQLLDAVFQSSLFSIPNFEVNNDCYLPFTFESYSRYENFPKNIIICSRLVSSHDKIKSIDIQIFSKDSNVCISEIKKMTFIKTNRLLDNEIKKAENESLENIEKLIVDVISKELGYDNDAIDLKEDLDKLGLDSVMLVNVVNTLEKTFVKIPKTLFFEYRNLSEIAHYIDEKYPNAIIKANFSADLPSNNEEIKQNTILKNEFMNTSNIKSLDKLSNSEGINPNDIAIIGIHGKYPESEDLNEYWDNIKSGKDCVTDIPTDRWDMTNFYNEDINNPKTSYMKSGGFIKDMQYFDPLFFKIPPNEVKVLDPQERLFLESCWLAIEDSGYTPKNLCGDDRMVGVYVGVMWAHYQLFSVEDKTRLNSAYTNTSAFWSIANRVSYSFDFAGASMAIDTACSSSLSALHLACNSILSGENEVALVGGVNLNVHPQKYYLLSERRFAAQDGRCRSFGIGGTGYVPGEGVGTIIIKSLKKAIEDKDNIHGIIKGTSVNHGGKSNGYSVPNVRAQAKVVKQAMKRANVTADDITFIEAHGTGTALGDPIEIKALKRAYDIDENYKRQIPIGSVKSNIGHLESAAGVASIQKVLLQLKHKQLAPSIHSETLNPNIEFHETPFSVQRKLEDWQLPEGIRKHTIGVSSFGAGGANSHVIIQEPPKLEMDYFDFESVIIILSAREKETLVKYATKLKSFLINNNDVNLINLAYTLQLGRVELDHRFAFTATKISEVIEEISNFEDGNSSNYIYDKVERKAIKPNTNEIEIYTNNNSLPQLAELWLKGGKIKWIKLYGKKRPNKISLPNYPFNKRRLWFKEIEEVHAPVSENTLFESSFKQEEKKKSLFDENLTNISQPAINSDGTKVNYFNLSYKEATLNPVLKTRDSIGVLLNGSKHNENELNKQYTNSIQNLKGDLEKIDFKVYFQNIENQKTIDLILTTSDLFTDYNEDKKILSSFFLFVKNIILDCKKFKLNIILVGDKINEDQIPLFKSLGSLFKVASKEAPKFRFRLMEFINESKNWTKLLIQELEDTYKDRKIEAIFYNELRYERVVIASQVNTAKKNSIKIRNGGIYVITGGMGAIGLTIARYLVDKGAKKVILLGRRLQSQLSDINNQILLSSNDKFTYVSADLSEDLKPIIDQIINTYGEINGLIHSAGIVKDKMAVMKSSEVFESVIEPKVDGVINIDKALEGKNVDFVLYCSSISAVEGQMGQIDYSAANRYMDEYACLRNKQQKKTAYISVNWPYWSNGGMRLPDAILDVMNKKGIYGISGNEGLNALDSIFKYNITNMIVFKHSNDGASFFFTDNHLNLEKIEEKVDTEFKITEISKVTKEENHFQLIIEELKEKTLIIFGDLLGLDQSDIDCSLDLQEYGIDSVGIMKLSTEMENLLDGFSVSLFFECETIDDILEKVKEELESGQIKYLGNIKKNTGISQKISEPIVLEDINNTVSEVSTTNIDFKINEVKSKIKNAINIFNSLFDTKEQELIEISKANGFYLDLKPKEKFTLKVEKTISDFYIFSFNSLSVIKGVLETINDELFKGGCKVENLRAAIITNSGETQNNLNLVIEDLRKKTLLIFGELLGLDQSDVDSSLDLQEYGVDSVGIMKLSTEMENLLEGFSVSIFFECETIDDIFEKVKEELESGNIKYLGEIEGLESVTVLPNRQESIELKKSISDGLIKTKLEEIKQEIETITPILSSYLVVSERELENIYTAKKNEVNSSSFFKPILNPEKAIKDIFYSLSFGIMEITEIIDKLRINFSDDEYENGISNHYSESSLELSTNDENITGVSSFTENENYSINFIKTKVIKTLGDNLGLTIDEIDTSLDLQEYGVDSVVLMKVSSELENYIENFSVSIFFECSSIDDLTEKLKSELSDGNIKIIGLESEISNLNSSNTKTYFSMIAKDKNENNLIISTNIVWDSPEVSHHIIQDRITLSGASYIDILIKSFEENNESSVSVLSNMTWFLPLFFTDKDKTLKVKLESTSNKYKISLSSEGVHAKGEVLINPILENIHFSKIETLKTQFEKIYSGSDVYDWFKSNDFIYKESYQVIQELHVDKNRVIGKLLNKKRGLNPMILDGAFQSIVGLTMEFRTETNELWVPFFIDKVKIYNQQLPEEVFSYVEKIENIKDTSIQKFSISILDKLGNVYLKIENFTLKSFSLPKQKVNSEKFAREKPISEQIKTDDFNATEPIAIISMSCKIPGINSPNEFWDTLVNERDLITEIPEERWDYKPIFDKEKGKKNKIYSKWGGFMKNIDAFDSEFFKIKDEDARVMDPQQRILLELTQQLFDSGGYTKEDLKNKNIGIIIGGASTSWVDIVESNQDSESQKNIVVNTIPNMIAARIADFYDLKGTAYTLDTACSSSLVSIHEACQKIRLGECDMVVAGGVTILLDSNPHKGFCSGKILSENGRCAVFDQKADGIVLGEGAGLVMLKSYKAALKDGDQVLGVIKGSSVNNDGKTMGLTTPSLTMQEDVIEKAFKNARINPSDISYFEAHGTGTLLGDPIEIKAATRFFSKYGDEKQFCGIGSVKSNVGHLLHASGVIGLIKILLSMKNQIIPATLHCNEPHSRFDFKNTPFYPNTTKTSWPVGGNDNPRRSCISSFGFGGTNCHLVLEESPATHTPTRHPLPETEFKRKIFWPGKPVTNLLDRQPKHCEDKTVRENENSKILDIQHAKDEILLKLKNNQITIEEALKLEQELTVAK